MRRRALLAAALALLAAAACGPDEPERRGRPGPPPSGAQASPDRPLAWLDGGAVVVRERAGGAARRLAPPGGAATAFAWSADGHSIWMAAGLEVWRVGLGGGEPERVVSLRDEANDRIARLEAGLDAGLVLAMTAGPPGPEQYVDARYWRLEAEAGAAREVSARDFGALAADPGPHTASRATPLVDPTGAWQLVVAPTPGGDVLLVSAVGGGAETTVASVEALPPDALGADAGRYTGAIADAGWAGAPGTVVFVAEAVCEDEGCRGPLFAVGADGRGLRHLASEVVRVPREWNGPEAAVEERGPRGPRVVVVDAVTGRRDDLGPGAAPRWRPS
jgi:hypothetical protein